MKGKKKETGREKVFTGEIEDNLAVHKLSTLYEFLEPQRARAIINRIKIKHGSWLNIAALELSILTRQGLDARIETQYELERQSEEWY